MDTFCVHFDETLVQLAWQFEGGKRPLTYLISCTVFLAPYALQIANSQKRTRLEPVPHNHFGPIDASKGNSCHGGQARIAENNMCSIHVTARNKSASHRRSKTPQEPAQHNHVGPTDAFKGRSRHGQLECIGKYKSYKAY